MEEKTEVKPFDGYKEWEGIYANKQFLLAFNESTNEIAIWKYTGIELVRRDNEYFYLRVHIGIYTYQYKTKDLVLNFKLKINDNTMVHI